MGGASRGTPGPQKNTVQIISSKDTKDAELILSSRLHTTSDEIKSNHGSLVMSPHSDTIVKQKLSFPEKSGSIDQVLKVNSVSESDTNNLTLDWSYPGIEQYSTGTITFKVTVDTKTSAHRYDGQGSPSGYLIDGKHSPYIDMIPGKTYRFDQSDSSNNTHPIKFYTTADKSEEYTTGVTPNGDAGTTGAYVEIVVSDSTPALLFYQCQSHGLMGNQIQVKGVGGSGGGSDTNTTYTQSWQDSGDNAILRLTAGGSGSGNNDLTLVAGNNITLTPNNNNTELTIASSGGGGSALTVKDETTVLDTAATTLKFVGDGVTASGTGTEKTITISGGGGGSDLTIQDEGSALDTAATTLNFVGSGVTASGTGAEKTITISGGGSSPDAFPSVTLPNDKQLQHKTLTGENTITVSGNSSSIFNDGTDNLEVTITPSLSSAKILVSVNTNIFASHHGFLSLQKKVGSATGTIIGQAQELNSNTEECNFKFIDTLVDQTPVTYTTIINNPSSVSQSFSIGTGNTLGNLTLNSLFDDTTFKFMWQAGKTTTLKTKYSVYEIGPPMSVSRDSNGNNYVSPANGNYFLITDPGALLGRYQKNLTVAYAIDYSGTNNSNSCIFHQNGIDTNNSGDARNHMVFINRSNGSHPNTIYYDNFAPTGGGYNGPNNILSTGKHVIVVSLTSSTINIYQDGSHINSGNNGKTSGDNYSGDAPIKIVIGGSIYSSSSTNFGDDKLYSVAVWNRTLSQSEAQSITFDMMANKSEGFSMITAEQISSARSFTTANPLLANPSTADKGKIVTVNSTGTDLEYGANFRELAYKQTFLTGHQAIIESDHEKWIDLSSHQTDSDWQTLNTDTTVNVGNGSKVMINISLYIGSDGYGDHHYFFRLGKKINNNVIWGSSNGISTNNNDNQTDPKGVSSDNATEAFMYSLDYDVKEQYGINEVTGHFVDEDPTNGQLGTHNVTYFIRFRLEYPEGTGGTTIGYIGRTFDSANNSNSQYDRQRMPTIVTVQELGLGAITSFTQEQALAGAGGTATFTAYGIHNSTYLSLTDTANYNNPQTQSEAGNYEVGHTIERLYDNYIQRKGCRIIHVNDFPVSFAIDFNTPQIVTKYRIWPRAKSEDHDNEAPSSWEIRASDTKALYDAGTYTILDSRSGLVETDWDQTILYSESGTELASDNLSKSNEYNLSTIGAYRYYVLYITNNCGDSGAVSLGEFALYGGGFTIPSQVGHSGKILKTNGTSLKWEAPVDALLPAPQPADKGKIITVNSAGDDLEYGANFRELACEQFFTRKAIHIQNQHEKWIDLSSHNTTVTNFSTDVTVNVSQNSKILVNCHIGVTANHGNDFIYIRLGKKVDDQIIWGSENGMTTTRQDEQTDPKGDYTDSPNPHTNRLECWSFVYGDHTSTLVTMNPHYIDSDPTNGLSGTHKVTYFIRIRMDHPTNSQENPTELNIGQSDSSSDENRSSAPTILSATELGSGAITSFTQEQALAGAGGTAAFTNTYKDESGDTDLLGMDDPRIAFNNTINNTANSGYWHNQPFDLLSDLQNQLPIQIGVNFTTPQIVTKYRIWARTGYQNQAPKSWQIRAAIDKATYDSGTFTILDSRNDVTSFPATSTSTPSDNLSTANEYNLSTIGAYQYYVFYFTESNGGSNGYYMAIGELALYGGGFTIPSQVGHSGRLLTTDGTSLGWSTTAALPSVTVPEPTSTNKGRALVSTGTGIEFSDFNSGVSTGFKVYKSGTAFEEVTAGNPVQFDQTSINVGAGSYSTTDGTYTVPVTGYYNIFANFEKLDVGFSCEKNGTETFSSTNTYITITDWLIRTPNHNINTNFDTNTGIFTVPCDGYYQANANIRIDGMGSGYSRLLFSVDNDANYDSGSGHSIAHSNEVANYHTMNLSQVIKLNKNQTLRLKIYSYNDNSFFVQSESTWSCHLIEQKSEFVLEKSTNSGTSYTDIKKAKNNLSETVYLNQNDLIRITSDTTNKLTFNQGELNNSFGAHLLNSGNSTSPIPIYGFSVMKNGDQGSIPTNNTWVQITSWKLTSIGNTFIEPSACLNLTSGDFTTPISGYYQVNATITYSNGRIGLTVNDSDPDDSTVTNDIWITATSREDDTSIKLSTVMKLTQNDVVRLFVRSDGSDTTINNIDSFWSMFLLATDTQTNTRQMGLSPIVPLHQLGHDQFADGTLTRFFISEGIDPDNLKNYRTVDGTQIQGTQNPIIPNSTQPINSTFTSSTLYYNYNGTNYTTVPASPYSSSSSPNWDYQDYIYLQPILNTDAHSNTYTCGSFTIDTSKILENYTGLWELTYTNNDSVRFKINGETFYNNSDPDGSTTTFGLYQKYINVEYVTYDIGGTENLIFQFHQTKADNHIKIAEPIMPSITLPTPNSNNNGKVLVSNGSGYALENSGARNQSYISLRDLTGHIQLSTSNVQLTTWNTNNTIISGDNFSYSNGTITIKNIGTYKITYSASVFIDGNGERYVNLLILSGDTLLSLAAEGVPFVESGGIYDGFGSISNSFIYTTSQSNEEIKFCGRSFSDGTAKVLGGSGFPGPVFMIEDMTPSAVPSINIPLPVAAHSGKTLTVNSQGTGLEYGELKWLFNSNKIYYNTDNVGIGTDLSTNHHAGATSKLDVDGRITAKYLRISFRDTSSLNSHIIANREYNDVGWQAFPRALDMSDSGHSSNVNSFPDGDGVPLDIQQYRDIRNSNSSGGRGGAIIIRQAVRHENYWRIGCDTDTGADSELQFVFGTSGDGFQAGANSHANLTFTGQHRCIILNKTETEINNLLGQIVVSSGNYCNLDLTLNPTIDESLPIVDISNTENSKKCFGIISHIEEDDVKNEGKRLHKIGNSTSILSRATIDDRRMYVNSLGEGSIWVCNKNSNLENGDYISSSSVPGYGMKQTQNEGILTNYTVAKITSDCNFSLTKIVKQKIKITNNNIYNSNNQIEYEDDLDSEGNQQMIFPFETRFLQADATQITEEEYNIKLAAEEEVYIACFVGCTYHCG